LLAVYLANNRLHGIAKNMQTTGGILQKMRMNILLIAQMECLRIKKVKAL